MSEKKLLHRGQFLALYRDRHWEYAERVNSSGAAFILAVTPREELVLVEQHRIPIGVRTLELPAGLIGDSDSAESAEQSALRELEEETGFRGTHAELLARGPVAAGLTSEMLSLVRVSGLTQVHAGGGVEGENIIVHLAPLKNIDAWLKQKERDGLVVEPRIYTALYFLLRPRLAP